MAEPCDGGSEQATAKNLPSWLNRRHHAPFPYWKIKINSSGIIFETFYLYFFMLLTISNSYRSCSGILQVCPGSLVHKTTLGGLFWFWRSELSPGYDGSETNWLLTMTEPCSGCNGPMLLKVKGIIIE